METAVPQELRVAEKDALPEGERWIVTQSGFEKDKEQVSESLFALSNGTLGVRGSIEELVSGSPCAFLADVYEETPISYHERHPGFAATTDTRVAVPDGLRIRLRIGDEDVDLTRGEITSFLRCLDLRRGVLHRKLRWCSPAGKIVQISSERVVPMAFPAVVAIRYRVEAINFSGPLVVQSALCADLRAERPGADPRIGASLGGGGLAVEGVFETETPALLQRAKRSGIAVATAQVHGLLTGLVRDGAYATTTSIYESFSGELVPGRELGFDKVIAYASGTKSAELLSAARSAAQAATSHSFETLADGQAKELRRFWKDAAVAFEGDPEVELALRFNLFHIFQAASRHGALGVAAKGLTGEGYEGHTFWDTELFVLPVMVLTAPALARNILAYRFRTLDAARAHARELNIEQGALYAWRTISGAECSAHYPSGSAQYHINAAIAMAVRLYDRATGDGAFLAQMGAEMVFETARVWMELGHFNLRRGGRFCIDTVTGPDEYTTLVDNNYYTNKMAQAHLRYAGEIAGRLGRMEPDAFSGLCLRLRLSVEEIRCWQEAADAMYLPYDDKLGLNPQDDTFLDKEPWDFAHTPADHFPLLLHHHPLSLYRRQVCKQADVVLAMVLAGEDVDLEVKRRNFEYYEPLTTHDSTLSPGTFSILASEIGYFDKAQSYFDKALFTDLHNLHNNTSHGVHLAAMAGSWLALAWGFGGLRCESEQPRFAPTLAQHCNGYQFTIVWRGSRIRVGVTSESTTYEVTDGPGLMISHFGTDVALTPGKVKSFPTALPRNAAAVTMEEAQ